MGSTRPRVCLHNPPVQTPSQPVHACSPPGEGRSQGVWPTGLASLALVLAGCGGSPLLPGALGEGQRGQPVNLLLVTLDTTRADRLGCYGYGDARTPNLDRLAREGVLFTDAHAPAPLTLPSHASMLTGAWPPEHGIRDNGRAALGPGLATLAEVYRDAGWRTGAVISSFVLDGRYGLGRGFDWYQDDLAPDGGLEERRADRAVAHAREWLAAERERPFMLWVHLFDPHAAYQAPQPFSGALADPYDAEVAFVDAAIGSLLDSLEEDGRLKDTLVVVVGDHGEALGEHGEWTHSTFLYGSTLRVPFLMHLPGSIPSGREVASPVSPVDLMPTLLDLFGWGHPDHGPGGRSLLGLMSGTVEDGDRMLYAESDYARIHYGWAPLRAVTTADWKYIRAPLPELFDRRLDPGEEVNLAREHPTVVAELDARLSAMERSMGSYLAEAVPMDAETARRLAAMGYLATGSGAVSREGQDLLQQVDPKDRVDVLALFQRGMEHLAAGRLPSALEDLRAVVAQDGSAPAFHHQLAIALALSGKSEDARRQLEAGLSLSPTDPDLRSDLGKVLLDMERMDEAEAQFRIVLDGQPAHLHARRNLVALLRGVGRVQEAERIASGGSAR